MRNVETEMRKEKEKIGTEMRDAKEGKRKKERKRKREEE